MVIGDQEKKANPQEVNKC